MWKQTWSRVVRTARALHRDEQGAEMLEYVLVFAAIALPLLAVVIWFWKDISAWAGGLYQNAKSGGETDPDTLGH